VDVQNVRKLWTNLSIIEENIDGPGYLLPLGKLGAEIIVRQADSLERKRFTIAHEVGHWTLGITCERKLGEFQQPTGVKRELVEKWCDLFAASFLVPRESIADYFRGVHEALLVTRLARAPKHFKVSEEAMFIRMYDVLGIRIAYIDIEARTIRVTRAFVPESVVPEIEKVLMAPEIQDLLGLKTFASKVKVGAARFTCGWGPSPDSRHTLLLLLPCDASGDKLAGTGRVASSRP